MRGLITGRRKYHESATISADTVIPLRYDLQAALDASLASKHDVGSSGVAGYGQRSHDGDRVGDYGVVSPCQESPQALVERPALGTRASVNSFGQNRSQAVSRGAMDKGRWLSF